MINITPVRFAGINNVFAQQPPKVKQTGLTSDVFVRSAAPAFNGDKNESFVQWAKRTDYLTRELPQNLFSDMNIIGSGFNHTAYKITDNDKYILRGPNEQFIKRYAKEIDYSQTTMTETEDKNLKINIGQPVASIVLKTKSGIPMAFFDVLKKQEGTSLGVPPYSALSNDFGELREGAVSYEADSRKEKYSQSLKKVANMPIESYKTLIDEVEEAAKAGYTFDYLNSNNILVDDKNKRFNLIDMEKSRQGVNYGNILYALTNYCYYPTYTSNSFSNKVSSAEKDDATDNTIKIIQKFMVAMQQKGVKFDKQNKSCEFNELLNSKPMTLLNSFSPNKWEFFEKNEVA